MTTRHLATLRRLVTLDVIPDQPLPTEFRLFTAGEVETTKGVFLFDEKAAVAVMDAWRDYGNDIPVDYDHAMTDDAPVDPALAKRSAGWFKPEVRAGELWATQVRWTPAAGAAVRAGEWKYVSPTFITDEDKRITELINCALTNLPATKRMAPLVAASRKGSTTMTKAQMLKALAAKGVKCDEDMSLGALKKMLTALDDDGGDDATDTSKLDDDGGDATDTSKLDDDDTDTSKLDDDAGRGNPFAKKTSKVAATKAAPGARAVSRTVADVLGTDDEEEAAGRILGLQQSQAQLEQVTARLARLEAKQTADARGALLDEGVRLGKVAPAERDSAFIKSLSTAQLKGYLATVPAKVKTAATGTEPAGAEGAPVALSTREKKIADEIGVPHDQFLARKVHHLGRAREQAAQAAAEDD